MIDRRLYSEFDNGWLPIIEALYDFDDNLKFNIKILQVKEKFGELRYYTQNMSQNDESTIRNKVRKFCEVMCNLTCELCGHRGNLALAKKSWYKTVCTACNRDIGVFVKRKIKESFTDYSQDFTGWAPLVDAVIYYTKDENLRDRVFGFKSFDDKLAVAVNTQELDSENEAVLSAITKICERASKFICPTCGYIRNSIWDLDDSTKICNCITR